LHLNPTSPGVLRPGFALLNLLALCLVFLPWSAVWSPLTGHDFARAAQVVLSAGCALWLSVNARPVLSLRSIPMLLIALLCCLAFMSTLRALHGGAALRELSLFAGMAATAWACSRIVEPTTLIRIATLSSAAYAAIFCTLSFVVAVDSNVPQDHRHLFIGYDNYRFLNHVQAVTLPLVAAATVPGFEQRRWRRLAWFAHFSGWILLFFTMGRGTLLGLGIGTGIVWLLLGSMAGHYLRNVMVGVAAGAGTKLALTRWIPAWGDVIPSLGLTGQLGSSDSARSRFGLWELAASYIGESPWLGIGPMHYANRPNIEAAHPHNIYLQIAAEWGVPMLVGLLAIAIWRLWILGCVVQKSHSLRETTIGATLLMACSAIAVDGAFSGNFVMPMSQLWIAAVVGVAVGWTRIQDQSDLLEQRNTQSAGKLLVVRCTAAALLALQIWLCISVTPELLHLDMHLQSISKTVAQSTRLSPRFWSNGWF
jgi:O-antigen ligase